MPHALLENVAAVAMPGESFLVTLSGGADSVALLTALVRLGHRCHAIHCNYHLRGDESNRDEAHARHVAEMLGVGIDVIDCDVESYRLSHPGESVEMACRALRYDAFKRLREQLALDSIAVGHHLEDNVETMLLNMLRGSGVKGLAGMSERRGEYVRPLLKCTKAIILEYLEHEGLSYVTDSSNLTNDYRRNALRNEIIPLMLEYFPGGMAGMERTLGALASQRRLLGRVVDVLREKYVDATGDVNVKRLVDEEPHPEVVLYELLNSGVNAEGFNSDTVENIARSAHGSGLTFHSVDGRAFLLDHGVLVAQPDVAACREEVMSTTPDSLDLLAPYVSYSFIEPGAFKPQRDPMVAYFDAESFLQYNKVVLRHPEAGDRLRPWGMEGSRLLSDIFTDLHLSRRARMSAWVLVGDGEVLWVVGYRASRIASVTSSTKRILVLTATSL